ncbi:MAG: hypothetical protein E7163_01835 [Firmicutes bacterium]|nr:hypothetical protein [Bacillota bacterium]
MPYHTEIMFFEILKLNYYLTGNESLKLNILEEAFYALQDVINIKEELTINNIFEEELEKLLENFSNSFVIEDDEIIISEDIELVYDEIIMKIPTLKEIDYAIQEYVQNVIVYKSLQIPVPIEETKELFEINLRIMQLYIMLGENEFKNKNIFSIISQIKVFTDMLKNKLNEIDNTMLYKIKMCCAHYNGRYLLDEEDYFTNSNWNIALFSNNRNQIYSLSYDKLQYLSE